MTNITFIIKDCLSNDFASKAFITPTVSPLIYSGSIIMGDSQVFFLNEKFPTLTLNLIPTVYTCRFIGKYVNNEFYIIVPETNGGTLNASDLITTTAPTGSIINVIFANSASYAVTASYALNGGGGGGGTTLATGSTYPITASWSNNSPIQLPDITDDTINHRIGINTTIPQYELDVNGNIGNTNGSLTIQAGPLTSGTGNPLDLNPNGGTITIGSPSVNPKICLNTSDRTYPINVNGTIGNAGNISGENFKISDLSYVNSFFGANGGNVGIGTNNPTNTLDVRGMANFGDVSPIGVGNGAVSAIGPSSQLQIIEPGALTDEKVWFFDAEAGALYWGVNNDTFNGGTNYVHISRVGNVATQFDLMYDMGSGGETGLMVLPNSVGVNLPYLNIPNNTLQVNGDITCNGITASLDGTATSASWSPVQLPSITDNLTNISIAVPSYINQLWDGPNNVKAINIANTHTLFNKNGNALLDFTNYLTASSITASLLGTASYANNAGNSNTASYVKNAISASYVPNLYPVDTSSFADTGSNTFTDNQIISGSLTLQGSNVSQSVTLNAPSSGITYYNRIVGPSTGVTAGSVLFEIDAKQTMGSGGSILMVTNNGTQIFRISELGNIYQSSTAFYQLGGGGATLNLGGNGNTNTFRAANNSNFLFNNLSALTSGFLIKYQNGSVDLGVIDYRGYVGIKTTTPQNALDVVGNISCSVITASGVTANQMLQLPYSGSSNTLSPTIQTGSMYVNVTNKLLYIYSGTAWMSSSMA